MVDDDGCREGLILIEGSCISGEMPFSTSNKTQYYLSH